MALVVDVEAIRSWLTARLDEDAQIAHRNTDGRGLADGFPDYRTYDDDDTAAADAYIEHFKPARALVEVAARRRRLERHRPGSVVQDGDETWVRCVGHEWVEWPCEDLIDDAQAWADRDDLPAELRLP